jgi:hypothetical protein
MVSSFQLRQFGPATRNQDGLSRGNFMACIEYQALVCLGLVNDDEGLQGRAPKKEKKAPFGADHARSTRSEVGDEEKYKEESLMRLRNGPRWHSMVHQVEPCEIQMSQISPPAWNYVCFFGKHFLEFCPLIRLAVNSAVLDYAELSRVCANLGRAELG